MENTSSYTHYTTPLKINFGSKKTYSISHLNFLPKPPTNFKGDKKWLVIGFDTEYQRVEYGEEDLRDKTKQIDNEVLSYQYSCKVVDVDNKYEEMNWTGIVVPESSDVENRLTLHQFLSIAIGHGIHEYPQIKLPREVYLVAHFNRADIPGFKDFKDDTSNLRRNLKLENIRNTFVNVTQDISINLFDDDDEERQIEINVKVRDSITLSPTGKSSLDGIGEVLNFPKLHLHENPQVELEYKQNMRTLLEEDWELFRKYAVRDAEICRVYTEKMIRLYHQYTGKFQLPITLTSIGVDLLTKYWMDNDVNPLNIVGKEQKESKFFNKRTQRYQRQKQLVSIPQLWRNEDFLTECYHGGRNEQFWFGQTHEDNWYDYDLSSAYPSAMCLIGHPDWTKIKPIYDIDELLKQKENPELNRYPADLAFAEVSFEFPEDVRYPCLPVRYDNGLIFPRTGVSSTHISEIQLAAKLGAKLRFHWGLEIPNQRFNQDEQPRPFKGFTQLCVKTRKEHSKGTLENYFWKELVNSTYGKTAQGLRERRIYNLQKSETEKLQPSRITNPAFASYITAFCRGTLSEIMNNLPEDVSIFSVTTDGFLTTATPSQMDEATNGTLCSYYKSARKLLSNEETIYEIKHFSKQLVGWRTRGQSTLKPSTEDEYISVCNPNDDDKFNEDNRYCLAKGGIKTPTLLNKREQVDNINQLFFNRYPNQELPVSSLLGIRDMYEHGRDLVDKVILKKLSMEYDWKRCPKFVGEVDINLTNIECDKHLFFSTKPWNSINEFNKVREHWEIYNSDTRHNLKTLDDYNLFKEYLEGKLSIDETQTGDTKIGTYLKKKDGLRHRLRSEIATAVRHKTAGTDKVYYQAMGIEKLFPTIKLKAETLAECLSQLLDIEVTQTDIYNDWKKKTFTPHRVPNNSLTRDLLNQVKSKLFPDLQIVRFLAEEATFTIESCDLKDCIESQKLF